jgi:hypothetical protein
MGAPVQAPRLDVVVEALNATAARFVIIGGFAVIAHRYVRATRDIDLLVPDDERNDRHVVAALSSLGGSTVAAHAIRADLGSGDFLIAGLASLVGFKRLAGRPEDRRDLDALAEIHGELPTEPIPGLDK